MDQALARISDEHREVVVLRYYADESVRDDWADQFPGDPIPERAAPPYDRDRHLPKRFADPEEPTSRS